VNIDLPQALGFISGITGLVAAYAAYRKLSLEGRDSVISNFQKITGEQRAEIDRLNLEHSKAIATLTTRVREQEETIVAQAGKIRTLEQNQQKRIRGEP
jgi:hypothetical protein